MIWNTLVINLFLIAASVETPDVVGTYLLSKKGANSTSWSTTTLELNCDSTVSIDLRMHMQLTRWEGFWRMHHDTVTIDLRPIITEDGKKYLGSWDNVNQFLVGKNKLTPVVTKAMGKEIKDENLLKDLNRTLKKEKFKKVIEKRCS